MQALTTLRKKGGLNLIWLVGGGKWCILWPIIIILIICIWNSLSSLRCCASLSICRSYILILFSSSSILLSLFVWAVMTRSKNSVITLSDFELRFRFLVVDWLPPSDWVDEFRWYWRNRSNWGNRSRSTSINDNWWSCCRSVSENFVHSIEVIPGSASFSRSPLLVLSLFIFPFQLLYLVSALLICLLITCFSHLLCHFFIELSGFFYTPAVAS